MHLLKEWRLLQINIYSFFNFIFKKVVICFRLLKFVTKIIKTETKSVGNASMKKYCFSVGSSWHLSRLIDGPVN